MKSASKMGSSTSFSAAWTTRSANVGNSELAELPDAGFGIITSRTGSGRNHRPSARPAYPPGTARPDLFSILAAWPSIPAVWAPLFPDTFHATKNAGS